MMRRRCSSLAWGLRWPRGDALEGGERPDVSIRPFSRRAGACSARDLPGVVDEGALQDGGLADGGAVRDVDVALADVLEGVLAEDPLALHALGGHGHRDAVAADRVCRVRDRGYAGDEGGRPVQRGADLWWRDRLAEQVADGGERFFRGWLLP